MFFSKKMIAESNTSVALSPNESVIDKLTQEIVKLRNQREEFQVLYDSNRQTLECLNEDLDSKTQECIQLHSRTQMLNDELQEARASNKEAISNLHASIWTLELKLEQAETEQVDACNKFDQLRTTAYNQLHANDEAIDERNDLIKALKADHRKAQQQRDRALSELEALKGERNSATNIQTHLGELQEKLDFTAKCNHVLKRSLRTKEKHNANLETQLCAHNNTDDTSSVAYLRVEEQLVDAQSQIAELQADIQDKHNLAQIHGAEKNDLQTCLGKLQDAHDQLLHDKGSLEQQLGALQRENDNLAAQVANANVIATHSNDMALAILQHSRILSKTTAEKKAQHQSQVDAMYARQIETEQCLRTQLQAKISIIYDLESKLEQSEFDSIKTISSRDDQIAELKKQLHRLVLDRDGESAKADAWQEHSNKEQVKAEDRIADLEAEIVQFKARA